jgi:transposase
MTIYCGVDFHARQQAICYCDTADGQVHLKELRHEEEDTRAFHSQLAGEVIVGLEASGYSTWFVKLLEGLGYRVRQCCENYIRAQKITSDSFSGGDLKE